MVRYINKTKLFNNRADALVNPVNCKGIMGKGIAKEFKKRYPECYLPYMQACKKGKLVPGKLMIVRLTVQPDLFMNLRPAIILFPTKYHWKRKSQLKWIEQGLRYLKKHYRKWGLRSIAMPQLGCGLGGLDWMMVKSLIEKHFKNEPLRVEVYLSALKEYNEKMA
jgi:O-acetyl-ADP-ribose deacetylase (regulator of RNase III)